MGCGGSTAAPGNEEKYKPGKDEKDDKKKDAGGAKTKGAPGGGASPGDGSPQGKEVEPEPAATAKPLPHSITVIHAEHRLECKFADVEMEHRQALWQIIRGQDTIQRKVPDSMDGCRVKIRTDFGGDLTLILDPAESQRLKDAAEKAAKEKAQREREGAKKKKKKKGEDEAADEAASVIDARELLMARAAPARKLQGIRTETLRGHPKPLKVAMLSPNDWLLVTSDSNSAGTEYSTARCTDIRTGLQVGQLDSRRKGVLDPIAGASFSTDGQQLVTIHRTDEMLLWDMNTFRVKKNIQVSDTEDNEMRLMSVATSPDMKLIGTAAGEFDEDGEGKGRVPVYDMNGKQVFMFREHEQPVTAVCFSPDSTKIVSGDESGQLFLWTARDGEVQKKLEGHQNPIRAVAFAPDGLTVYSLDEAHLSAWDVEKGEVRWTRTTDGNPEVGQTAMQVAAARAESPRDRTGGRPRMRFTTVCLAANGVGILGMVDRRAIVFDIASGDEIESVKTKAPVSAMSAGCRACALGDIWGNIYLAHIL